MSATIDSVAGSQHGLLTRADALRLGLTARQVQRLVRSGEWIAVARGVYRIAGAPQTWEQRLHSAVLIAGDGAAASHQSAARLWRLPGFARSSIHVTQVRGLSRKRRIGILHETTSLPAAQIRHVSGIAVTSPERTIVDLFSAFRGRRLKRAEVATANMLRAGHTSLGRLAVTATGLGGRGRAGTVALRAVLAKLDDGEPITESELEELVMTVVRGAELPMPRRQVRVSGTAAPIGRLDFLFPPRLVLEANSRAHHGQWLDEEADAIRDLRLTAAGYDVLRATWRMLVDNPDLFCEAIAAKLAATAA